MGEGELDESFDTLKEISDWILNHPSGATEINERLTALEEATGVNQTTTEEQPKVDEEGNPVYIQETQDDGEGGTAPLYWDGLTEDNKTIEDTGYPVMIENPDGDEPPYIQEVDDDNNLLYWNVTDDTPKTTENNDTPMFIQDTETVEVPVENDVEKLKAVTSDLDLRINHIEDSIFDQNGNLVFIDSQVGNLDDLLLKTEITDEGNPQNIVEAINILDNRTRWIELQ